MHACMHACMHVMYACMNVCMYKCTTAPNHLILLDQSSVLLDWNNRYVLYTSPTNPYPALPLKEQNLKRLRHIKTFSCARSECAEKAFTILVLLACSVVLLQRCALIGVTVLLSCAVVLRVVLLSSLSVPFSYKITRIDQESIEMV